jgi:Holliday junction resolvase-like predicted endonuclease
MAMDVGNKLTDWQRRRELSGSHRTARYPRSQGWELIRDFGAQFWWLLALMPFGFVLVFLPLALRTEGVVRGAVIGGAAVSGLWFDVLVALVWTGAGSKFMGASGEAWTSEVLRELGRDGWRLVNNVTLTAWGDIDHVLVGPGGVVVVESKWSANRWPVSGHGARFMDSQKKNAASQAQRNAKDVGDWLSASGITVPVMSLGVFWTGARKSSIGWEPWRNKSTILVNGPSLREWTQTELPQDGVDSATVDRVYSMLGQRVDEQDRADFESGKSVPPTIRGLATEWALKPMAGMVLAVYAVALTRYAHDWRIAFAAAVVACALGLWAASFGNVRGIAIGWTIASFGFVVALVVLLIHAAIG